VTILGLAGDFKPLSIVEAQITSPDGTVKTIKVKARVDTEVEIEYLKNGGVLHYVLRNLARAS
jgi:aconitate hydratase